LREAEAPAHRQPLPQAQESPQGHPSHWAARALDFPPQPHEQFVPGQAGHRQTPVRAASAQPHEQSGPEQLAQPQPAPSCVWPHRQAPQSARASTAQAAKETGRMAENESAAAATTCGLVHTENRNIMENMDIAPFQFKGFMVCQSCASRSTRRDATSCRTRSMRRTPGFNRDLEKPQRAAAG
jgi:hypothetical protein